MKKIKETNNGVIKSDYFKLCNPLETNTIFLIKNNK